MFVDSQECSSDVVETMTHICPRGCLQNMDGAEKLTRRFPVLLSRWVLDSGIV